MLVLMLKSTTMKPLVPCIRYSVVERRSPVTPIYTPGGLSYTYFEVVLHWRHLDRDISSGLSIVYPDYRPRKTKL